MSNIFSSNRLEILCLKLADNICKPEQKVFAKETIITQSAGMNAWLKTKLAEHKGVFANFEFMNQDGFLAEMYQLLFKERLQNNFDTIKYKVFDCLDSSEFKENFQEIAKYYTDNELRRFQLSAKIADLFDQYQLYRPEMIDNWDTGALSTNNPDEKWQQWLWKRLGIESRAKIKGKIVEQMAAQKDLILQTYPAISLFGITVYTKFHLDFFHKLAKHTQVNFYVTLPSIQSQFENELLLSFGSKAGEQAQMFSGIGIEPEKNEDDTLLSRIQNNILNNESGVKWQEDDSIQINSCYTPVREAECLYNYLLDLFEKDKELRPRDVLVMTTDINKYAPYIKAVFRNAPVNIPFQVSGAANNSDDSMTAALEQILKFTEEDLTSEKVVSLLEQKRIKKRFGINDCNYIRSVVRKANIRFGRENRAEDDSQYVSWKYGLEKILLGYAMLTDEEYPISENLTLYPYKDNEASESHDLLRLKAFVEILESVIDAQKEERTLNEWKRFLFEDVIEKMIYHDDFNKDDRTELSSVYRVLSFTEHLEFDEKVSFAIFLDELKTKHFTEPQVSKLDTGRVTITSPIPVRGLPYKVICFMGLNNDIFPRKDSFMGFDLLGEEYRIGDRNKKETDKYLFLETILAAREKLYLSYIGQSVKDNTEIPPSIVVDTLLDYAGREDFVVKHPLHGFSSRYQKDNKRLFTYLYAGESTEFPPKTKATEELTEISVNSFVKFFEHPIEWYFNNILGIKYEESEVTLPESELFELDQLQKWRIKNDLIRLKGEETDSYLKKNIKEGLLPLKNLGKLVFDELVEETENIKTTYQALTNDKDEQNIVIDIPIDKIRIRGNIGDVYDRKYIACSFSKTNEKNLVRAYLRTILLCINNEIDSALLINIDGTTNGLTVLSSDDAQLKLEELLVYFRKGMCAPLKFTLKATNIPRGHTELSIDMVLDSFQEEANGNYQYGPNKYMQNLTHEGYFKDFDDDDLKELKILANLLNLTTS